MESDGKLRLLRLLEILQTESDEQHPISIAEITEMMKERWGLDAYRITVQKDIEALRTAGYEIETIRTTQNRYYLTSRPFELPELKLLLDAVESSKFITQKKSRELAKKLTAEASEFQRKELRRNITATHRVKANNEQIYYTVDTVNEAINKGKKISFKYTEYTPELKKVFRNDGEEYTLSPYALFWNEDYYYVVGWSDKHENVSVFRADRLYKPEILKEKAVKRPDGFSLDAYSKQIFEMYDGDPVEVRLGCRNDLAKYVVDRFGDKLETKPLSSESFEVTVEVALSPTFYGWLFGFAGGIRILGPSEVIAEYNEMLNSALTAQSL